ncbi:AraC family transcriptional regulator [Sinobaca sp. H24]|uniref:helix-turn-helix domain-containing protein n=1 Tax=Sinobaca sp. H24 TaxID=2923376 RepID=UPI00207AABB1|nr:helix-turn-helix domain-containing protein [Sinobaca sp. H24]
MNPPGISSYLQPIAKQLTFFHYTTRLPIYLFNRKGEKRFARPAACPSYIFDHSSLQRRLIEDPLLNNLSSVQLLSDADSLHFIVTKYSSHEEEWIVVGPFLLEEAGSETRQTGLMPKDKAVPNSDLLKCTPKQVNYLKDMLLLIKRNAYLPANDKGTGFKEDIMPEDQIFQQDENYTPFPFKLEQQFLHLLSIGDDQVLDLMAAFDRYHLLTLANTPVRSIKNNLIVFVNTIVRTAVEAGLDPLQTIKLGESMIKNIEVQKNIENPQVRQALEQQMLKTILLRIKRHLSMDYTRMTQMIIEYIEKHLHENVSLKHIAAHCNRHPNYLSTTFKKDTGYSIQEFLLNKRINKAKHFLRHSTYSILDISYYCGFQSQSYFTYQFKKITSQTPNEFRNGG